jgi:superfamily II DNA/RNA helicase
MSAAPAASASPRRANGSRRSRSTQHHGAANRTAGSANRTTSSHGARSATDPARGATVANRGSRTSAPSAGTFGDLGVPADLVARLVELDRATPFPVQAMTLADSLAGRDLCVKAPTGSGKTLAFSLPLALRTRRAEPRRPQALVLVPTRELASQVRDTLAPLAEVRRRRVTTVYGGTNLRKDQDRLRRGVDVLVATPGRLADLVSRGDADLSDVAIVVLDEADRMADMGFLPEVVRLLDRTRPDRQTLLFSATLDGDIDELTRRYQRDPARHELTGDPDDGTQVRHLFWPADRDQRRRLTGSIVRAVEPAIVFTRTKHGADRLVRQLRTDGIAAATIHGDRTQSQRERALEHFRTGEVTTLVATDVAARGIHVDDIGVVVHYDLAGSDKDYQHRSGRTGRAGASGVVVTFVGEDQHHDTAAIQRALDLPRGLHAIELDDLTSERPVELAERWTEPKRTQAAPRTAGAARTRARTGRNASRARRGR